MISPIPKPGPKPKKPRKSLKRTPLKAKRIPFFSDKSEGTSSSLTYDGALTCKRKTLPKTNPERKRERHMRDFDGGVGQDHHVREGGCEIVKAGDCEEGPIQAAHVQSRGAGGRWFRLVGLCYGHHRYHGQHGTAGVLKRYGVDLEAAAKRNVLENLKKKGAI